ncbi:hypothetical protein A1D23_08320 [Chelonobacter oris]|uniref:hypothetical protein n=1 Tax=Chelonobacter oris TaxID=505317 RepID=UPI002447C6E0|nr:hypothetical protein [Chelonobacter oris]MDH3000187.1 hypothetical protein [Chelonobacter oris]
MVVRAGKLYRRKRRGIKPEEIKFRLEDSQSYAIETDLFEAETQKAYLENLFNFKATKLSSAAENKNAALLILAKAVAARYGFNID